MKARVTFLLVIWQIVAACKGGHDSKDASDSSDSVETPATNETATNPQDASGSISSPIVNEQASDPAIISGCNLVFQIDPIKADPAKVSGYVVGYPETFKVEPQSPNGTYIIKNVPEGEQDIIIMGAMARPPESTAQDDSTKNSLGIRINGLRFTANQTLDKGEVELPRSGSIKGIVRISDRPDCDPLVVISIPGTTIPKVKCNASGEYEFLNLPVGIHRLTVSREGYKTVDTKVEASTDSIVNVPTVTLDPMQDIPMPEWITISPGSFKMGSDSNRPNEQPTRSVSVREFQIARTEVTVAQYQACVKKKGCTSRAPLSGCAREIPDESEHPADCVAWDQAVKYCEWAGGRLPSEAEWEYAARGGGKDVTYPWGPEVPDATRAVYSDVAKDSKKVCSTQSGNTVHELCDMAGNVWEWVQDWDHSTYLGAPVDGSAWLSPVTTQRVMRGGSASSSADSLRTTFRTSGDKQGVMIGFRCARDL